MGVITEDGHEALLREFADTVHNEICQAFLSSRIAILSALDSLPDDSEAREFIEVALRITEQGEEISRHVLRCLSPDADVSLFRNLAKLVEYRNAVDTYSGGRKVNRFVLDIDESVRVAPEAELKLFRIVQEAATNAAKYSGASNITISVARAPSGMTLFSVSDDGCGFDLSLVDAGYGTNMMKDRAAELGGELSIVSSPGRGSRVDLHVPNVVCTS